jgi:hypothetical protein
MAVGRDPGVASVVMEIKGITAVELLGGSMTGVSISS